MKRVINGKTSDITTLEEVSPLRYYGVSYDDGRGQGDAKCFVVRSEYESGQFVSRPAYKLTTGNTFRRAATLMGLLAEHLGYSHKVYEFDTAQELFKWLSE